MTPPGGHAERILAHRGCWRDRAEQNTPGALGAALAAGFGIETDLRDRSRRIVISHDMPGPDAPLLDDVLSLPVAALGGPLALNIKADGLARTCRDLPSAVLERAFFFDMAVPDMREWLGLGLPVFTRHSDVETVPVHYAAAAGVWMDEMLGPWITGSDIARHLERGKRVGLISSELYGRPHHRLWAAARDLGSPDVMICTDLPEDCLRFLEGVADGP
ncbi:MAG: hypothetical protein ACKOWF_05195 [Chloroflexota bacterium]